MYHGLRRLNVAPHRRGLGLVFQSFALWPHLTARGNIEFPLKAHHVDSTRRRAMVDSVARLTNLDESLLDRYPGQLSGGQQQRIALARALVLEPTVMLFDEPLSNLDANLREQLRIDLKTLHRRLGFTGIYVTHDLVEALALGDRVAVMQNGGIEQIGSPTEVFQFPQTQRLAQFLGFRRLCRIVKGDGVWNGIEAADSAYLPPLASAPRELQVYGRPEHLKLAPFGRNAPSPNLRIGPGVLERTYFAGDQMEALVSISGGQVQFPVPADDLLQLEIGKPVAIESKVRTTRFYDGDGRIWSASAEDSASPTSC
jgi:iron(III) transport system ATP-binding protein